MQSKRGTICTLSKAIDWLKNVDIVGIPIQLLINEQVIHKSSAGSCVSLGLVGIIIYTFITMCMRIHDYPLVFQKTEMKPFPEKFEVLPENFFVIFGLLDKWGKVIENRSEKQFFQTSMEFCLFKTQSNNETCVQIDMVNCSLTTLDENIRSTISPERLRQGTCMNTTTWNLYKNQTFLEGSTSQKSQSYLRLKVKRCRQADICANMPDQQTMGSYAYLAFQNNIVDPSNFNKPFQPIKKEFIDIIDGRLYRILYMTKTILSTLNNFFEFFAYSTNEISLKYEETEQTTSNQDNQEVEDFLVYQWSLSDQQITFNRSYDSLLDVLVRVSGVYNFLFRLIQIIGAPMFRRRFHRFLSEEVFMVKYEKDSSWVASQTSQQRPFNNHPAQQQPSNSTNQLLCKYTSNVLDIKHLIKQSIQIEYLKRVLFDDDQITVFNHLQQPLFSTDIAIDSTDSKNGIEKSIIAIQRNANNPINLRMLALMREYSEEVEQVVQQPVYSDLYFIPN